MDKLTLEHLAPYLPYGLPMMMCNGKIGFLSQITQNNGFGIQSYKVDLKTIQINGVTLMHGAKPILRPLSDLTKEIEHNGESFVPMDFFEIGDDESNNWFEFHYGNIRLINHLTSIATHLLTHDINYLPHAVVVKLYEWHFDVFGLIAAGLAVDRNTLK